MVPPSASLDAAVRPTVAATAAFSATVLVAEFESVGVDASNSSMSVMAIEMVAEVAVEVSALVAVTVMSQLVTVS